MKVKNIKIGPLYDLLKEFYNEMGDNDHFFHIYTLDRFLSLVNEKDAAIVSTDVVQEVKDYIESPANDTPLFAELVRAMQGNAILSTPKEGYVETLEAFNKSIEGIRELSKMAERIKAVTRPWTSIKVANDRLPAADKLDEEKQTLEDDKISDHAAKAKDAIENPKASEPASDKVECDKDSIVDKAG